MQRPAVRKAIIPAAGLGTRFLPATKAVPKELLPIVDVPTIQLIVEEAVAAGIREIVLINGRGKSAIEDHFDHAFELEHTLEHRGKSELLEQVRAISTMVRVISVRQKQPLGLGHAVLCGRDVVGDEPFAVLLGDDLLDNDERPGIGQLIDVYNETGGGVLGLKEVPEGQEHLYGIVAGDTDEQGRLRVRQMVEKPAPGTAPSRLAIVGRYVFPPQVWEPLAKAKPSVGGEIQLIDGLHTLMAEGGPGLYGLPLEGTRYDAGDRVGYLQANLAYALKRPDLRKAVIAMCRDISAQ
jgi:UTP--glucose-1-phosphate uridylyltransferase